MSHADEVRKYCVENIIEPARRRGEKELTLRAGDVHAAMAYKNRMPLVCAALGAKKFEDIAEIGVASCISAFLLFTALPVAT